MLQYHAQFRSPKSKVQFPWRNHVIVEYVFIFKTVIDGVDFDHNQ